MTSPHVAKRSLYVDQLRRQGVEAIGAQAFDDVSVETLAEALSISRRTFFRYFPAKEDIVVSIFDDVFASLASTLGTHNQTPAKSGAWISGTMVQCALQSNFYNDFGRSAFELIAKNPSLMARFMNRIGEAAQQNERILAGQNVSAPLASRLLMTLLIEATERWARAPTKSIVDCIKETVEEANSLMCR